VTQPDTEFDPDRVVVRDKRRLDPETGEVRAAHVHEGSVVSDPAAPAEEPAGPFAGDDRVAELTADLQRVSAEYANYRKRVDRDRTLVVEMATAGLLNELLPLLDDVDRARQHGDLDGAFKSVGEGIEAVATKLGLERFGEIGEPFDPAIHEALMAAEPNPEATVATCAQVLQPGYRLVSGRVLRPARVAVAEPAGTAEPVDSDVPETPEQ
jgi:molecular chaperone GrpE